MSLLVRCFECDAEADVREKAAYVIGLLGYKAAAQPVILKSIEKEFRESL